MKKLLAMLIAAAMTVPMFSVGAAAEEAKKKVTMSDDRIDQLSARDMRNIALDIVYVQERNTPDANAALYSVAETLDELLDVVPYSDGSDEDPVPLHTHERDYSIEDQELHYRLRISQRGSRPVTATPMQTEETDVQIKD